MSDIWMNMGWSAVALACCLVPLWMISLKAKDASLIDIFWGLGFVVVALVCFYLAPKPTPYLMLLTALPVLWGLRLSLYLARRNLGHGEDPRYVAMMKRAEKKGLSEMAWRRRSLMTIYFGQGFLVLLVSAPLWVGSARGLFTDESLVLTETMIGPIAIIGTIIWLIGFLFEAIGDWQLARFLKKNKSYDGPYENKPVLASGLWKYTRHPNYFGNAMMWWGIFLVACQVPYGWVTIFAPIIMNLLLVRVSGKDLLERKLKKRPAYQDYVERTPGFVPWFPKKAAATAKSIKT